MDCVHRCSNAPEDGESPQIIDLRDLARLLVNGYVTIAIWVEVAGNPLIYENLSRLESGIPQSIRQVTRRSPICTSLI